MTSTQYAGIEDALAALRRGQAVIVLDAEDRENEGDFICAAELVTPQTIDFLITQGRGQLCLSVLPELAERLGLTRMVPEAASDAPQFAIPLDHRGCRSGISPLERAVTIRRMLDATSTADDFQRPGHIFPLIARAEGVLVRPGHTEAAVDLMRLAGLKPAGVLCEICSRDGLHMATGDELFELAFQFGLPVITIDELVAFRQQHRHSPARAAAVR